VRRERFHKLDGAINGPFAGCGKSPREVRRAGTRSRASGELPQRRGDGGRRGTVGRQHACGAQA